MKTRKNEIFWKGNEFEYFGGGLIGLFLKDGIDVDLDLVLRYINSDKFKVIMMESNWDCQRSGGCFVDLLEPLVLCP